MRRDRELSYYGSEDLTPSEFYHKEDAEEAFEDAKWVFSICNK
jgi:HEPN domain-containing protein